MTPLPYWIVPRAQRAMNNELARFPQTETGGLLLGHSDPAGGVRVWEATDGGYEKVLREESAFAYDREYVGHLCALLSGLYTPPLEIVGVWHKHNSPSSPVPFSRADEEIHRQLVRGYDHPCLSVLFERTEEEDVYEMRVFHLTEEGYRELCEASGPEAPAREAASGSLPSYQEDLIDDAIFSVQNGSEYRAQQALKTMMRNYQNEGNSEAARLVDRVL